MSLVPLATVKEMLESEVARPLLVANLRLGGRFRRKGEREDKSHGEYLGRARRRKSNLEGLSLTVY